MRLYKKEANSKIKSNQLVDRNKAGKKKKTHVIDRPIELGGGGRHKIGFYLSNIK